MFLQNFVRSENVLGGYLEPFSEAELIEIDNILKEKSPNVRIRGVGRN